MAAEADACPGVLNYTFNSLQTGKTESLCQFRGKVLLIVNTASYCGYTHQFEGLEALYRKYKSAGLVVLGFPSNDFGGQEPGSNKEIAEFCRLDVRGRIPDVREVEREERRRPIRCSPISLRGPASRRNGISTSTSSTVMASASPASVPASNLTTGRW